MKDLRVAVAHEWLVEYGGSERCVEQMLRVFPDARLLTTLLAPDAIPVGLQTARPSFLQHVPGATSHHGWFLPLMPAAWRLRRAIEDVDVVVSSSHACAKAVRIGPGIPHLCYCHTPMRYAWQFEEEAERFPKLIRPAAAALLAVLRGWDRRTADHVTRFVANSHAVAGRIERFYGRTAEVIHPPVRTSYFTPGGERTDEFLYVGRLVAYKRPDAVVAAFADLPYRLNVVGSGHLEAKLKGMATDNVRFLGNASDPELRGLYRAARALVFLGHEDFGIAMAEAQACGTPVIAAARGGALDIVEHGTTGWLVDDDPSSFRRAVAQAARNPLDHRTIRAQAERFSESRFRGEIRDAVYELADSERPARRHRGAAVPA